jgi:ABC-type nitrate/sulfonate/bicarbonate transport system substrate-binding protein
MLDGKLRIAPTCYHVLHQMPVMAAHEMNFFYDEGLKTADGSLAYQIVRDPMVPFGLEKLGISQAMKEKSVDIALDVQSRTIFYQRSRGADVYIIAGWRNQHTATWMGPPHIKSLADLKGKRVGISDFNSIRHWGIQVQLRKAGLDIEKDVEWVRCGVSTHLIVDALKAGKIECAPITSTLVDSLKKEGCNVLVVPKDSYPNGRPERIIAATGKILEERPDLVKSFLKGLIRSYWFVRDMPKNFEYLYNLDKRLRLTTADPEERLHNASRYTPLGLERMPFPIDGLATGMEDMLREEALIDGLNFEVPAIEEVCAQDLVTEAYKELRGRKELDAEYQRVRAVADRCGY